MANKKKAAQGKVPAVKPATSVASKAKGNKPALTAAQRRAKAQAAQNAQAKWERIKKILIGAAILVVVAIIVVMVIALTGNKPPVNPPEGDPASQITPPSASDDGSAIVANPAVTDAALTLNVHVDYQCPICKTIESLIGSSLETLAARGDISLQYNLHTFLDGVRNEPNTSSTKAALAATCADTLSASKFQAYHDVVFANQPAEGVGYTDDQLRNTFATQAGISGDDLATFQTCFDESKTSSFVKQMGTANDTTLSTKYLGSDGKWGTPTLIVNGTLVPLGQVTSDMGADPDALLGFLKETAGIA